MSYKNFKVHALGHLVVVLPWANYYVICCVLSMIITVKKNIT